MIKYRIFTALQSTGEVFNPRVLDYDGYGDNEWHDLWDYRWTTWYPSEEAARIGIFAHKRMKTYVPQIIEVE